MQEIKELDFFTKNEIESSLNKIAEIINTGIFDSNNSNSPFVRASFIQVLILLRDLMYKSERFANKRIDFTDDVIQLKTKNYKVKDVSDLIKFVRDALCHPDVPHHYFDDGIKASFNIAYGKAVIANINGVEIKSDYEDDICFFFGKEKIYLKRHILRAYKEAMDALRPLIQ